MKHGRWTTLLWVAIGSALLGLLLVSTREFDSDAGRYVGPIPKTELPPLPVMVSGRIQFHRSTGHDASPEPEPTSAQPDAVPDTAAGDTVAAAPKAGRIITEEIYSHTGHPYVMKLPYSETKRTLTGEEVERKGGIFEAVKTVPGVIGK